MRQFFRKCLWCIIIVLLLTPAVYAFEPYTGYTYDSNKNIMPGPNGYSPERMVTGRDINAGGFKNPEDIFIDRETGLLYIADTGNKRIVVADKDFSLVKIYSAYYENGQEKPFVTPTGLFVSKKGIFVADTDAQAVLWLDADGNLIYRFTKPDDPLYQSDVFSPKKVLLDHGDNLYVLSTGSFQGAVVFDNKQKFCGHLGSVPMHLSLKVLADYFWKQIMNESQIEKMARYVPREYNNFAIDSEGFIHTVYNPPSDSTGAGAKAIFKLSGAGTDIYPMQDIHGDSFAYYNESNILVQTRFVDLCIDDNGFVNALDITEGRIFQYDSDGNLLFIFGGLGNQMGLFQTPVAIDVIGESIFVLDKTRNLITVFSPTEFGHCVHKAVSYYEQGLYGEAEKPWLEALKYNSNFPLAYKGLAKAKMEQYNYEQAMEYFRLGLDKQGYSKAFKQLRINFVRENYWIFIVALALLVGIVIFVLEYKKAKKLALAYQYGSVSRGKYTLKSTRLSNLYYVLRHPISGFDDMSYYTTSSYGVSFIILGLWVLTAIIANRSTGFIFSNTVGEDFNIFIILLQTVVLFAVWCASNWIFSVLLGGRGTFKNIWCASAYCLVPTVIASIIAVILSHFLILEESMFYQGILTLGQFYSAFLIIVAMKSIHEYTLTRTVVQILLTVFGMLATCFLAVLTYGLVSEVVEFFKVILSEVLFRM